MEPAVLWSLLWKHGGLVLSPHTVLVRSLRSYYDFVWFDPARSLVSADFFQILQPRHPLAGAVIRQLAEQQAFDTYSVSSVRIPLIMQGPCRTLLCLL